MKKFFTALLLFWWHCSLAQCECDMAGALSLHITTGVRNGFGGELGQQGIGSSFSGFLGLEITSTKGRKGTDSTVSLMYVKGLYRFYQNNNANLNLAAVVAPGLINTDFEFVSGLRLLYVTGRLTAVSAEPLWYINEKKFHFNINLHLLL